MDGLLEGKSAIITGAGSGVGRAAALIFSRHGAKIAAADIDLAAVEETVRIVRAEGGTALALPCNVADEAAVNALVHAAVEAYGRLDIMYNNAGITIPPKGGRTVQLLDTTKGEIDRIYGVNIHGVINGCRAAIRQFERQGGGGVIVTTASVAGLTGYGGVAYGSSKGAVTALTRALAMEVAGKGIRVNSVCPAGMPTNFMPGIATSEAARKSMGAAHPLGRPIEPEECANAALFLASDLASNITGVNLPVDGGLSAGVPMRR